MLDDKIVKTGSNEMELVDFRIFRQGEDKVYEGVYGVNVSKVREIIKVPVLTELPGTPHFIEGVFDFRGVVVPVINLAKWMGIKEPESGQIFKPRVIITEFSNVLIGFIVHEAKRIRRISWKDIEPASFSTGSGAFDKSRITGVTRVENDEVLLILDLESVVEDLGIYTEKVEVDDSVIPKFSGIALTLDDSLTARKRVKSMLQKMGLQVVEAKDGAEGLQKIDELYQAYGADLSKHLKIIVSDVEMPKMDGYKATQTIRDLSDQEKACIPIIAMTANAFEEDKRAAIAAGMNGHIAKPIQVDKLLSILAEIIRE